MRGYSERECFTPDTIGLFEEAAKLVARLEEPGGVVWRCHEIARAVCEELRTQLAAPFSPIRLEVCDGLYHHWDHSWILITASPLAASRALAILDVYAIGKLPMVQLVGLAAPHVAPYDKGPDRADIRQSDIDAIRAQWSA